MTKLTIDEGDKEESHPTERLIAFVDFLGFRSVITGADEKLQQIILATLEEIADQDGNFGVKTEELSDRERRVSMQPAFTSFSDNVLISFKLDQVDRAGGAYWALMLIRGTVCALAHRAREFGCLIRGAVTTGLLYQRDRVAFGPGLVRAYELESKTAFFPRVIVTPELFALAKPVVTADGLTTEDRAMFRDTDGYWCLDYMTAYLEYLGSAVNEKECIGRRAWALGARAKALDTAAKFAHEGNARAAQNWAWFADRFEKSMHSVSQHKFSVDGTKLDFP